MKANSWLKRWKNVPGCRIEHLHLSRYMFWPYLLFLKLFSRVLKGQQSNLHKRSSSSWARIEKHLKFGSHQAFLDEDVSANKTRVRHKCYLDRKRNNLLKCEWKKGEGKNIKWKTRKLAWAISKNSPRTAGNDMSITQPLIRLFSAS